ncbi:MAG: histidinol-phosphate transaminase [Bacteroidia bacterium]
MKVTRLNANENFYGCSPDVLIAIRKKIPEVNYYPDFHPSELESEIAKRLKLQPSNIVAGAGSVRIIEGLIYSLVDKRQEVLTFERSFAMYRIITRSQGKVCRLVPQKSFVNDIGNLLPFVNEKTKLIFIDNPCNPTGTIITHSALEKLLKKVSKEIYVVIDEAYYEYVIDKNFPDSRKLFEKYPNLIILRSFSKMFGLAGLRIGYAAGNEKTILKLKESRIPYPLNYLATTAAIAAMNDKDFITHSKKQNEVERKFLYNKLNKAGVHVVPSQANFLFAYFDTNGLKENFFVALLAKNILVCDLHIFGFEKCLRIGVGDRNANAKIIKCAEDIFAKK